VLALVFGGNVFLVSVDPRKKHTFPCKWTVSLFRDRTVIFLRALPFTFSILDVIIANQEELTNTYEVARMSHARRYSFKILILN